MSTDHRARLRRAVRRPAGDPVEAALCIAVEGDPAADVDVGMLHVDAITDTLRTRGTAPVVPAELGPWLAEELHGRLGFRGNVTDYHDPDNALMSRVLERRTGLPILLSALWVGVAQRLRLPAWGIALPGHYYVGLGSGGDDVVVVDPFDGGRTVSTEELSERLSAATNGQLTFRRALLRPASLQMTARRILNNLTRDYAARDRLPDALWTVEMKLGLPNSPPSDHRERGDLLVQLGRYGIAADAYEDYLDAGGADPDGEIRARAVRARAKLN